MSIFQNEDTAWSAWTKAIEEFSGDPGSPLIVQSPTIMRPLQVPSPVDPNIDPDLAWFRKLLVGDTVPFYGNRNPNAYVPGARNLVSLGYEQYLNELNREVIARFVNPSDKAAIAAAHKRYESAQMAFVAFRRQANSDWKRDKLQDPTLSRVAWEETYGPTGYRPQYTALDNEVKRAYGQYKALYAPYPQVERVGRALARLDLGASTQVPLPRDEDDVRTGRDGWDSFLRTNLDLGMNWNEFFTTDVLDTRSLNQTSKQSSYYNHSWSAGGSFGWKFFSASGGASGGTVENHLATATQGVSFTFKRLVSATVTRGSWYDPGLLTSLPYFGYVDANAYWGPRGTLNLVPIAVIIGRGLTVEISTSAAAVSSYQNWRRSSGSLGFGIGSFRIGASGSSSTQWGSTTDTSSGSTIKIEDNSGQAYVIGVVLMKMDQVTASMPFVAAAEAEYAQLAAAEAALVARVPALET